MIAYVGNGQQEPCQGNCGSLAQKVAGELSLCADCAEALKQAKAAVVDPKRETFLAGRWDSRATKGRML